MAKGFGDWQVFRFIRVSQPRFVGVWVSRFSIFPVLLTDVGWTYACIVCSSNLCGLDLCR